MNKMTHRERLLAALNHQTPDRVPLDLGSHTNGSIHTIGYEKLKAYLKLSAPPRLIHRWMQVAEIDEAVLERFDIDTRRVPWGAAEKNLEVDLDENRYRDAWGVVRYAAPGAQYYELERSPMAGELALSDILNYPWPDPEDPGYIRGVRQQALKLRQETDFALILKLPSPIVHTTQFLRGFNDWFMDFAADPNLMCALMDAVLEINLASVEFVLKEVGDLVDVVSMADDLGTQDRLIISPAMYRKYIKPRHKIYFDKIHSLTNARILFHTCGSIWSVLHDLVEIGVDAFHPVQVSAAKMDTASLKAEVGSQLTFWGGVDTHTVLPHGSPQDVRDEVAKRITDLAENGGYVLSAVHNIQPDVPPENICALFEAGKELGRMEAGNLIAGIEQHA